MNSAQRKLIRGATEGDRRMIEEALEAGAVVNQVDSVPPGDGRAPLHHAAAAGQVGAVTLLLDYGANINIQSHAEREEGATPLHLAAYLGSTEVITVLLDGGADAGVVDRKGKTPVHWAALTGCLDSLMMLERYGCDLHAMVGGGGNTLHFAAASGVLEAVEWLVEREVDAKQRDKNKCLPRDVAKSTGHKGIHKYLKEVEKRRDKRSVKSRPGTVRVVRGSSGSQRERAHTLDSVRSVREELNSVVATPTTPIPLPRSHPPIKQVHSSASNKERAPKKKWLPLKAKSYGGKSGLKMQVEELKDLLEEQEELTHMKDLEISRLKEKLFAADIHKVKAENKLQEANNALDDELRKYPMEKQWREQKRAQELLAVEVQQTISPMGDVTMATLEKQLREVNERLQREQEERQREREAGQEELEAVRAALEVERQERLDELEAGEAKVEALTAQLQEAHDKMRRNGLRQKRTLNNNNNNNRNLEALKGVGSPSGLPNLGNTCYLNAVVQCLYGVVALREYFTNDSFRRDVNRRSQQGGEVALAVAGLFKALSSGVEREIRTRITRLKEVAGSHDLQFEGDEVRDAHDLLSALLTWLHHDLQTPDGSSIVSDLFFGEHESSITCDRAFEVLSRVKEPFCTLSLALTRDHTSSLQELLSRHYRQQFTDWDCPHCGHAHSCRHQTKIRHLPPLLLVHISRYNNKASQEAKSRVTFPAETFSLLSHTNRSPNYELVGTVNHHGETPSGGHYTSFCRAPPDHTWRLLDDDEVRQVSPQRVLKETDIHILFYAAKR